MKKRSLVEPDPEVAGGLLFSPLHECFGILRPSGSKKRKMERRACVEFTNKQARSSLPNHLIIL